MSSSSDAILYSIGRWCISTSYRRWYDVVCLMGRLGLAIYQYQPFIGIWNKNSPLFSQNVSSYMFEEVLNTYNILRNIDMEKYWYGETFIWRKIDTEKHWYGEISKISNTTSIVDQYDKQKIVKVKVLCVFRLVQSFIRIIC